MILIGCIVFIIIIIIIFYYYYYYYYYFIIIIIIIIIDFIYRRLQLLVKNIPIQIDKEIHSYHKKKSRSKYPRFAMNVLQILH